MSKKTKEQRQQEFVKWTQSPEGKAFHAWWKQHRYSGFATDRRGRQRFGIPPYEAWAIWKYKAEFFAENGDDFLWPEDLRKPEFEDIEKWCLDRQTIEGRTKTLEKRLGGEFWKNMATGDWYAAFKKTVHEQPMNEKIENAYAYEPGQSQEETEYLSRRRE